MKLLRRQSQSIRSSSSLLNEGVGKDLSQARKKVVKETIHDLITKQLKT